MTASGACGHPRLGAIDKTDITGPANDSYATRHNPFVYFQAIIGARPIAIGMSRRCARSAAICASAAHDARVLLDHAEHLHGRT